MRRRRLLQLSGVSVTGLAGCLGITEPSESTSSPNTESEANETTTPTDSMTAKSVSLSAELDSLQPAVVTQPTADSIDIEAAANTQYLYLDVTVNTGTAPTHEDLRVRFDGREFGPIDRDLRLWRAYNYGNARYDSKTGSGWLLFPLPETGVVSDVALVGADGSDESPIVSSPSMNFDGRLESRSPPLSLEWSVPDTVEPGATPTLSFTVTNEGDHDGTFVAALNRSESSIAMAPITAIRKVIPPGEPTTFELTDTLNVKNPGDAHTDDGASDIRYDLYWAAGTRSQQVQLVGDSN